MHLEEAVSVPGKNALHHLVCVDLIVGKVPCGSFKVVIGMAFEKVRKEGKFFSRPKPVQGIDNPVKIGSNGHTIPGEFPGPVQGFGNMLYLSPQEF